jgi:hypothetical protein
MLRTKLESRSGIPMKRITKQITALLGLAVIVGTGSAQTWTVNGAQQNSTLSSDPAVSAAAIDPITGQLAVVTSACTSGCNQTVTVTGPSSNTPSNTNFTVSWTATGFTGAVTCVPQTAPSGIINWPAGQSFSGATGSVNNVQATADGNYTLQVTCNGVPGSSGNIVINGACPSPVFDMLPAPAGSTNPTPLAGGQTAWSAFFGRAFPGLQGDQGVANLSAGEYIAVSFQSSGFTNADRVFSGVINGGGGQTKATIAISECPGVVRTNPKCTSFEGDPSIGITSQGANFPLSFTRCVIIPGRPYFLNIANRVCDGPQCSTILSVQTTTNR